MNGYYDTLSYDTANGVKYFNGADSSPTTLTCTFGYITSVDFSSYGTSTGTGPFVMGACHATSSLSLV